MKNLRISEDFERESLKDFVYLYEEERLLDAAIQKDTNRRPAKIIVVDKDKILERKHEYQHNPLPF